MELTPSLLAEYLRVLKDAGVESFEGMFSVRFSPEQPEPYERPEPSKPQRSMWENEKLWPGGKPPEFQKKAP